MAVHGIVRATVDVDVLVVAPAIRYPEVFSIVRGCGFRGEDRDLIRQLRERYVAEMRADGAYVEILVPVLPYHATLVDRARVLDVEGARVPFVAAEDLVVLKALWFRAKDVLDIERLLAALGERLDLAYVRATLGSILPDDHPRHAELEAVVRRVSPPPTPS